MGRPLLSAAVCARYFNTEVNDTVLLGCLSRVVNHCIPRLSEISPLANSLNFIGYKNLGILGWFTIILILRSKEIIRLDNMMKRILL